MTIITITVAESFMEMLKNENHSKRLKHIYVQMVGVISNWSRAADGTIQFIQFESSSGKGSSDRERTRVKLD